MTKTEALNAMVTSLERAGWRLVETEGAQTWYDATPPTRMVRVVPDGTVVLDGPSGMVIVDPGDARIATHIRPVTVLPMLRDAQA